MGPRSRTLSGFRRWTGGIVVALYAVLSVLGGLFVECHEPDGSVAVEWRLASCCAPGPAPGGGTPPGSQASAATGHERDCGDCDDVDLGKRLTSTTARAPSTLQAAKAKSAAAASAFVCPPAIHVRPWTALPSAARAPPVRPPAGAPRAFVLRC